MISGFTEQITSFKIATSISQKGIAGEDSHSMGRNIDKDAIPLFLVIKTVSSWHFRQHVVFLYQWERPDFVAFVAYSTHFSQSVKCLWEPVEWFGGGCLD